MSESTANTWAFIVLSILFVVPFLVFSIHHKLFRKATFRLLATVINKTALVYLAILFMVIMYVTGNHPIILDPQYPEPDEILAGGITIGFIVLFIFVFIPIMLILNVIRKFSKEKLSTNTND